MSADAILASLAPLFKKARAEGLWFRSPYQDMWFSPDDLAAEHKRGKFIWSAENWQLRDPADRLAQLAQAHEAAKVAMLAFAKRIGPVKPALAILALFALGLVLTGVVAAALQMAMVAR